MYQPILVNKTTFESLSQAQQDALKAASAKAETFYLEQAKLGDSIAAKAVSDAGVELAPMTEADFNAWRDLAKTTAYPATVAETPDAQGLLDLALSVEGSRGRGRCVFLQDVVPFRNPIGGALDC